MIFQRNKNNRMRSLKIIKGSSLFDPDWYLQKYPDVKSAGVAPHIHYFMHGAVEGRDPSALFSTISYMKEHPDLLRSGENPIVHYERSRKTPTSENVTRDRPKVKTGPAKIPKLLHSVWLSNDPVPAPLSLSVNSFLRVNEGYQVKNWTLADLDEDETAFLREALAEKKWAFATDYIRLKALYEYGGIYADGDVAFYKPVDEYLHYDSVFVWENYFAIGPHFLMAAPRNAVIGRILEAYRDRSFYSGDDLDLTPMPVIVTWILTTEYGLRLDGSRQVIREHNIVETENIFTTNFTDGRCIAEHMYYGGWIPEHGSSYKDALIGIATRWAQQGNTAKDRLRKRLSTSSMEWRYYFLKNAETAFPAISELPELEHFRKLKERFFGGSLVDGKAVMAAVSPANPLRKISKWHLKPKKSISVVPVKKDTDAELPAALNKIIKRGSHKVSVVVPIYNVEKYLVKCLKSIQMQDHQDFEVILVDDGSTDNSGKIARLMADTDPRFKFLSKKNGGLGDARNFAIPHLVSDLVTFVDSDDFLTFDHLSQLEAKFRQGHDLAICDIRKTTPDGRLIEKRELGKFWNEPDPVIQALVSHYECYAWNKMYPTEVFSQNDLARYSLGWFEDLALTPALIACSSNIGFVGKATYNYVQRPDSILSMARKSVSRNIEVFTAIDMLSKHRAHVPEHYWNTYMNWMAPKHYFYWRVIALLGEKSHGARVAYCDMFARALNEHIPDWDKTEYIIHFIKEPASVHQSIRRQALVDAFKTNDLAFYGLVTDLSEYGL